MSDPRQWHDLLPRVLSGLALAMGGVLAVWAGGWVFAAVACLAVAVMAGEAGRMFEARAPWSDGALAGGAVALAWLLPGLLAVALVGAVALAGAFRAGRDRGLGLVVYAWIMLNVLALIVLRAQIGIGGVGWLIGVVVISDIAGYFAGRVFGGPKFWPAISPKKTWSGTLAGWAGAALLGALVGPGGGGAGLAALSVLVAIAGQMGDIGESALKRRVGVKDSADLIPGHGGLLDRFDALLGATALTTLLWFFGLIS